MKKIYKFLSVCAAGLFLTNQIHAQAINETFGSVPQLFTNGWAQQNLSSPVGTVPNWFQGSSTVFTAYSSPDTSYIAANYNSISGAGTISNWLFTPNRTFQNGDVISFYSRTSVGTYPDRLQLRLSTNGTSVNAGTTSTSVGDFTNLLLDINPGLTTSGYPATWTQYTVAISGLSAPTSGRLAFRYFVTNGGPSGTNSDYIGIDNFVYTPTGTPPAPADVTVGKYGVYTLIPQSQVVGMALTALVSNVGSSATTDATLKVNVYLGPNFTTPVQSFTSAPSTIAAGASLAINAGTYTPSATGNYAYQFISDCTNNTATSADTSYYVFSVVNNMYAKDDGQPVQGIGAGSGASAIIGNTYKINATTNLDSVLFFINPGPAGLNDSVRVHIANTTAGVPDNNSYVGFSAIHLLTAAETTTNGALITLPVTDLSGNRLSLSPGTYFVGIEKTKVGDNYGLQCSANIFVANTIYANLNGGTYTQLNTLLAGFNYVPIIRPFLNTCVAPTITVNSGAICAGNSYTLSASGATTYTYSSGAVVTPTATTSYTVTGETAPGCGNTAVATVTVNNLPTLLATTNNTLICVGQTATLSVTGASTYTWSTTENTTDIAVSPTVQTTYSVTGADANGCENTTTITQDVSICTGIVNLNNSTFNVYPNPNKGIVNVELSSVSKLTVTNALGQVVVALTVNAGKTTLNLNDQPSGVYYLNVVQGSKNQVVKLIKE